MYKIVDSFNGHEASGVYDSWGEAQIELFNQRQVFYSCPCNKNSRCMLTIVKKEATWQWDYALNKWAWS